MELDKLSLCIFIPIHNESLETIRKALSHYLEYHFPIHIIDSSENVTVLPSNSNLHYHHFPGNSFLHKIQLVVDIVSTNHILLSPVDDLCCLEKILYKYQHIIELNNFAYLGGEHSILSSSNFECKKVTYKDYYKINMLDSVKLFSNYRFVPLWGLYSNKTLNRLLQIINRYYFSNDNFIELSFVAILPKLGNVYETEETFFYRSIRENSWGRKHKKNTIFEVILMTKDQKTYFRLLRENNIAFINQCAYLLYLTKNSYLAYVLSVIVYVLKKVVYKLRFFLNRKR